MYVVFLHTIPALVGTGLGDMGTGTAWVEKSLSVPVPVVPVSMYPPGIPYPCRSLLTIFSLQISPALFYKIQLTVKFW